MSYAASKALMELRVHMCQSSVASKGIRCRAHVPALRRASCTDAPACSCASEFWSANYNAVKAANMKLPILLRENANAPAKLTATYEGGEEKSISVEGMSSTEFGSTLTQVMKGQ